MIKIIIDFGFGYFGFVYREAGEGIFVGVRGYIVVVISVVGCSIIYIVVISILFK